MKKQLRFFTLVLVSLLMVSANTFAKKKKTKEKKKYEFTVVKNIPHTSTKDQARTGTCWCFATTSFIESEILKNGFSDIDLSEMYFVNYAYRTKAEKYVMRHGVTNFSEGGQAHDVIDVIREHGFVPDSIYRGIEYGEDHHDHAQMVGMLTEMLKVVAKAHKVQPVWFNAVVAVLNTYLGEIPEKFSWNGSEYTPKSFAKSFKINPDDYVEFTSYSNYPMHKSIDLDIPDNWSFSNYYNVNLKEFVQIIDTAIGNGYSVVWDGDVSNIGFRHRKGIAVLPQKSDYEDKKFLESPQPEKEVTCKSRLKAFLNHQSTDDHLMHLVGTVVDQNNTKYYTIKNSWAADSNDFNGEFNMSLNYVKEYTVAIMVNKNALPKKIRKMFNL